MDGILTWINFPTQIWMGEASDTEENVSTPESTEETGYDAL